MGRGYDGGSQTQIRPASANTPDEQTRERATHRAAVRAVVVRARNAKDARLLLDVLGLHPAEGLNET